MPEAFTTVRAWREAVASGATSAEAACQAALDRIDASHGTLHAFRDVSAERALTRARALDRQAGPKGPLHGVPVAIKDNMVVAGETATAGSRILDGYVSPFTATVVDRLEAAGAVIVGKTICDEFSMGSSTENCAFGPAKTPGT